jgi:hypothetical protein
LRKSFSVDHPHLNPLPEGEEIDSWIYEGLLLDRKESVLHASLRERIKVRVVLYPNLPRSGFVLAITI